MKPTNPQKRKLRIVMLGVSAMAILGLGCVSIRLPPPADDTVEKRYLPRAKQGDAQTQWQLALAYHYGTAGAEVDNKAAWEWLEKAVANNHPDARLMSSQILLKGDWGQAAQPVLAMDRLRKLAEENHPGAQVLLATILEEGRPGIPPQIEEAAQWYQKAARSGHRYAALRFARLLEQGRGIPRNGTAAYAWYQFAKSSLDTERLAKTLSPADQRSAAELLRSLTKEIQP